MVLFMGFLDASKAFDRLKHSLLFQKLIAGKYRVILFGSWYIGMLVKQCMYVGQEYCRTDFMS